VRCLARAALAAFSVSAWAGWAGWAQVADETPAEAQPLLVSPAEGDPARELVVATKEAPPFAFRGPDGEWTGISIEPWPRLADELDLAWRLEDRRHGRRQL
jgi:hypothetical protein